MVFGTCSVFLTVHDIRLSTLCIIVISCVVSMLLCKYTKTLLSRCTYYASTYYSDNQCIGKTLPKHTLRLARLGWQAGRSNGMACKYRLYAQTHSLTVIYSEPPKVLYLDFTFVPTMLVGNVTRSLYLDFGLNVYTVFRHSLIIIFRVGGSER